MKESPKPWHERIDKTIFGIAMSIMAAFFIWALTAGEEMDATMQAAFDMVTETFGWWYLILGVFFVIFAVWLAAGRYGKVKLGKEDDEPEYSYFSWFAMLFACGYGVGIVFWGAAEPLSFFIESVPPGVEAGSSEAAITALAYAFLHWGWPPWAIYLCIGLPLTYFMYKKDMEPRFSSIFKPLVGEKHKGILGKILDSALIMAVIGAITTSLGLGIMQLVSGMNYVFGVPETTFVYLIIAVLWIAVFGLSAISGIDKGIKRLSNINIPLAIILTVFVFLVGPTLFNLDLGISAFGYKLDNFFNMSLNFNPVGNGQGWVQGWTVFYWAWWISAGPATGMFVANISKGRTIREVVVAHMITAPVATWAWFLTFGGTAIFQQSEGIGDPAGTLATIGEEGVVYEVLSHLPLPVISSVGFMLLIFVFLSTTADSFSYVCAQVSTKRDSNPKNPPQGIRALYAAIVGMAAVVLVIFGEGITGLQLTSIISSFLVTFIMVAMCFSLVKVLKNNETDKIK